MDKSIALLKNKNLLIVDDEADIGEILCWELGALKANCTVATSVKEALALLKLRPLHAVVSDIRMPEQTGIELLKAIRQSTPELPCLLMTGFSDLSLPRAHEMGAEALIAKPFELDELCRTIAYYTTPLPARWDVKELRPRLELQLSDVWFGRGGFLVGATGASLARPLVGEEVCVSFTETQQVFQVVCRWHLGEKWAAEIIAWNDATKVQGWSYLAEVPFIPFKTH